MKSNIDKLLSYVEQHKYKGYDPYDLKGQSWYIKLLTSDKQKDRSLLQEIDRINNTYPQQLRKVFHIKPKINNKALALFGLSYLNLYKVNNNESHLNKAKKLAKKLAKRANQNYSGLAWGYPFDWKSGEYLFPENTPSVVVSVTVGKFYLELYKLTKKKRYLDICKSIVVFIKEDLFQTKLDDTICFSYTPHDTYQIHNANLMGAEFLSSIGILLNDKKLLSLAKKSVYFTLNQQNKDGSIYYYGNNSSKVAPQHLDIYHSGFEIRSLINLYKNLQDQNIKKAFLNYLDFFLNQYILEGKIPKLAPKIKNYPVDIVDIHGLAEALLTLNSTKKYNTVNEKLLKNIYQWGIKNMQLQNGSFRYRWINDNEKIETIDILYMRWGQAWMLFTLTQLYKDGKNG